MDGYIPFEDLPGTKKADLALNIVAKWRREQGYNVFIPEGESRGHFGDTFVCQRSGQLELFIEEIKAKAHRSKWTRGGSDTGYNYDLDLEYGRVEEAFGRPYWISFVDEYMGWAYGGWRRYLHEPRSFYRESRGQGGYVSYPLIESTRYGKKIIYFPTEPMTKLFKLTPEECARLKEFNKRNWDPPTKERTATMEIGQSHLW